MSLLRQLWIIVLLSTLLAFIGGFAVNLVTAKHYLEEQLLALSNDTASSLALTITQQPKDQATVELLVESQFDSGHFRQIRVVDVHGKTIIERRNDAISDNVPGWFASTIPLKVAEGTGLISDGWNQWGKITVVAHDRFAYQALWDGALRFMLVMAIIGALSAAAVTRLIQWVGKPLRDLMHQAESIGERIFITIAEPNVIELRRVVRTMNMMVERVKAMFSEQAERIDELRASANRDRLTSLPNRDLFMGRFRSALSEQDGQLSGGVVLIRLTDLAARNRSLGRAQADDYIRTIAHELQKVTEKSEDHLLARMNGTDFAILAPGLDHEGAENLALECKLVMAGAVAKFSADPAIAHIGVAFYKCGESNEGSVLLAVDQALGRAESGGINSVVIEDAADRETVSIGEWKVTLDHAIATMAFELTTFPVLSMDGTLIHEEGLLRLRAESGELLPAGQFMPLASRLGYLARLDLVSIELACIRQIKQRADVAINISPSSIDHPGFLTDLDKLLAKHNHVAPKIWFEINEQGLGGRYDRIAPFGEIARRYHCKVGIEHFGRQFGRIPALYELRLDYIKIDGGFVRDIDMQEGNQQLVKAIVGISEGAGISVIAEATHSAEEWATLQKLGIRGATGPYATRLFAERQNLS